MLFYSLSSKYSLLAAICPKKLLKHFQRERTPGTDHTETSVLHPRLLSRGINPLLLTVPHPRPGHVAVRRGGEGRQPWLAAALRACPHARSPSPALPLLPGAGSRCPFPSPARVHLASDPLRIFVLIFRCYLATCHFASR